MVFSGKFSSSSFASVSITLLSYTCKRISNFYYNLNLKDTFVISWHQPGVEVNVECFINIITAKEFMGTIFLEEQGWQKEVVLSHVDSIEMPK